MGLQDGSTLVSEVKDWNSVRDNRAKGIRSVREANAKTNGRQGLSLACNVGQVTEKGHGESIWQNDGISNVAEDYFGKNEENSVENVAEGSLPEKKNSKTYVRH